MAWTALTGIRLAAQRRDAHLRHQRADVQPTSEGMPFASEDPGQLPRSEKRGLPMHRYPFTLIRGVALDEPGQPVFKRTLWLWRLGSAWLTRTYT